MELLGQKLIATHWIPKLPPAMNDSSTDSGRISRFEKNQKMKHEWKHVFQQISNIAKTRLFLTPVYNWKKHKHESKRRRRRSPHHSPCSQKAHKKWPSPFDHYSWSRNHHRCVSCRRPRVYAVFLGGQIHQHNSLPWWSTNNMRCPDHRLSWN